MRVTAGSCQGSLRQSADDQGPRPGRAVFPGQGGVEMDRNAASGKSIRLVPAIHVFDRAPLRRGCPPGSTPSLSRIIDVREITKPISSPIRNAYIDFTKMTTSLVAVVTDVVRDGKPVVGYGFNSNGRYGQGGLIRERFAPRLKEADPKTLLDETGDNLDPDKVWAALMSNEKPGGHGERRSRSAPSTWRCGTRWRRSRASRCSGCWPNATARRQSARVRLCRRRLLLSRQGSVGAARRDARLSRSRLQCREDEDRRRADPGRPPAHRGGAAGDRQ